MPFSSIKTDSSELTYFPLQKKESERIRYHWTLNTRNWKTNFDDWRNIRGSCLWEDSKSFQQNYIITRTEHIQV
uniref:Uncharacterized protein n=1 Tax=Pelusios castaneus TaxID=367368 RepID=A0A8C8SRJ1_9SAUR